MSTATSKMARPNRSAVVDPASTVVTVAPAEFAEIALVDIVASPQNARKKFKAEPLQELADSVKEHGVLQAVVVRPIPGGKYMLIDGERRFRASSLAGKLTIPASIKVATDVDAAIKSMVANLQREDINDVEEAREYRRIMDIAGWTQEQLAEQLHISRSVVANKVRLLAAPDAVLDWLEEGKLTASHVRPVLELADWPAIMTTVLQMAIDRKAPTKDLEGGGLPWSYELQQRGLITEIREIPVVERAECAECPFGAHIVLKRTSGSDEYCARPEHAKELQARGREREAAARAEAKATAVQAAKPVQALPGPSVAQRDTSPKVGGKEVQEPARHETPFYDSVPAKEPNMPYGTYAVISRDRPTGCTDGCPCLGYGQVSGHRAKICTKPRRYANLQAADVKRANDEICKAIDEKVDRARSAIVGATGEALDRWAVLPALRIAKDSYFNSRLYNVHCESLGINAEVLASARWASPPRGFGLDGISIEQMVKLSALILLDKAAKHAKPDSSDMEAVPFWLVDWALEAQEAPAPTIVQRETIEPGDDVWQYPAPRMADGRPDAPAWKWRVNKETGLMQYYHPDEALFVEVKSWPTTNEWVAELRDPAKDEAVATERFTGEAAEQRVQAWARETIAAILKKRAGESAPGNDNEPPSRAEEVADNAERKWGWLADSQLAHTETYTNGVDPVSGRLTYFPASKEYRGVVLIDGIGKTMLVPGDNGELEKQRLETAVRNARKLHRASCLEREKAMGIVVVGTNADGSASVAPASDELMQSIRAAAGEASDIVENPTPGKYKWIGAAREAGLDDIYTDGVSQIEGRVRYFELAGRYTGSVWIDGVQDMRSIGRSDVQGDPEKARMAARRHTEAAVKKAVVDRAGKGGAK